MHTQCKQQRTHQGHTQPCIYIYYTARTPADAAPPTDADVIGDAADKDVRDVPLPQVGLHLREAELLVVEEGRVGVDVGVDALVHLQGVGVDLGARGFER